MLRSENLNILVVLVKYGVPQGSVLELRPLLYLLYTAEIPAIFSKHSSSGHIYADDVQAFVHGPSSDQLGLFGRNDALSQELHLWMSSSQLEIAESKQYAVYLAQHSPTRRSLTSPTHRMISLFCLSFQCSKPWRGPGQHVTFSEHVANLIRSSYFHQRRPRATRRSAPSPLMALPLLSIPSSALE